MRFGNVINDALVIAPKKLEGVLVEIINEDGKLVQTTATVSNPTAQQYLDAGYLPVVEKTAPEAPEGKHYEQTGWRIGHDDTTNTDEIVPAFALVDDPDPEEEEISADEALDIIFGGGNDGVD